MCCMEKQIVEFRDLGKMDYKKAWDYQDALMQKNLALKKGTTANHDGDWKLENEESSTKHYLLFVEHPPVYTLGKSGKIEHVLMNEEQRMERGIEFYHTQLTLELLLLLIPLNSVRYLYKIFPGLKWDSLLFVPDHGK